MNAAPGGVTIGRTAETYVKGGIRVRFVCAVAICAGLAACEAPKSSGNGFRDLDAPIAATTRFEPARFAGTYRVVAEFSEGAVAPSTVRYDWDGVSKFAYSAEGVVVDYAIAAPGRMVSAQDTQWVLWVDADYRTVAIGTPSGAFGRILERGPNVSPDRMAAAREIYDWFGYDMTKLRKVQQ